MLEKKDDFKVGDKITCYDYEDRKEREKVLTNLGYKVIYVGKCDIQIMEVPKK